MEFCRKFYEGREYKVVLFGLLLSLLVLNEVECQNDCYYYQALEAGQTYYAFSPNYPYEYYGEKHCIWKMTSPYDVKINCTMEMYNCDNQDSLSVQFSYGIYSECGYKTTDVVQGKNPTIRLDTLYSRGRFLCEIKTENNNNNNNCKCGWKKVTRIVGGQETGVNEYPMMSGLVDFEYKEIYCGSTIISEQYVITAVHCIQNKNIDQIGVVVGEHDVTTGNDTSATKLFRLARCIIHPMYQGKIANYDIAVCKIIGKIEYSAEVGPVCLPFQHERDSYVGNNVTALGWGLLEYAGAKSNILQKVNLNVINLNKCKETYADANNNNMCTYTLGKDTCQMDSGGPILWQNPNTHRLVLAGIISAGIGCASKEPSIEMRTGAFMDWIVSVTPDAQYCRAE